MVYPSDVSILSQCPTKPHGSWVLGPFATPRFKFSYPASFRTVNGVATEVAASDPLNHKSRSEMPGSLES